VKTRAPRRAAGERATPAPSARREITPREPERGARAEARLAAIGEALDEVRARCDAEARRENDPVGFVHGYTDPDDRELVALLASALAFGNVKALRAKIEDALQRIGPGVARAADDPAELARRLRGWKHRVYRDEDLVGLLVGARRVQRARGSLGAALAHELKKLKKMKKMKKMKEMKREGDLQGALAAWVQAIRREGGLDGEGASGRRGRAHILADPSKGSAVKRLMLFLRWMVRPADGVDLGAWALPTSLLLVPVDTHIHKLSRNLGLTRRNDVSWKTAEEITRALARFDADDPVKYDFSLCHLGMLQRCPSRRDPVRCEGCGVQRVCRHWA
jgi:uncharacterized protein (TIGR02757 family)